MCVFAWFFVCAYLLVLVGAGWFGLLCLFLVTIIPAKVSVFWFGYCFVEFGLLFAEVVVFCAFRSFPYFDYLRLILVVLPGFAVLMSLVVFVAC